MENTIDYTRLNEITVKTQRELNDIPDDFQGQIYINDSVETINIARRFLKYVIVKDNATVKAWGNATVKACDNATVAAFGNVQVVRHSERAVIQLHGNAREVHNPGNIAEFLDFYGIEHDGETATLYKAVRKRDGRYYSDRDRGFEYVIGEVKCEDGVDTDVQNECGKGIHISTMQFALNFGRDWDDLAILEVKARIADIVCPKDTDGKVRTGRVEIIREVPLIECGVYGRILAKMREKK